MGRISIKGVLIGGVVDIGTSVVFGSMYGIYAILKLGLAHASHEQAAKGLLQSVPIYLGYLAIGFACSVLGGYIAGRIAKHDELLNGTLSSFLCLSLGIFTLFSGNDSHPFVVKILLEIASPTLGLFGGYLALLRRRTNTTSELTA